MLDIKLIRDNPDLVKTGLEKKGFGADLIDEILRVDTKRRSLQLEVESRRSERNKLGRNDIAQARQLKQELEVMGRDLISLDAEFQALMLKLPNLPREDVPVGPNETVNSVIKTVGQPPTIDQPLDHMALAAQYDLIDIERASKISGSRFGILKNQAVLIELALAQYGLMLAQEAGFTPMIPPVLVNHQTVLGTGYLPHGEAEVYKTQDDLYLVGTSELALVGYHADEIINEQDLPRRYAGWSSCFRREAGSYGKDTKGIFRQHQFDKLELVSFVKPADSSAELARILELEERLVSSLGLAYQVVEIGTGDLGIQAAQKYDIETWIPSQGSYRETHSCSNTTSFQARRLNIRYKDDKGLNQFVHTLNGTALAIGRILIAILENGQQPDGRIKLPACLVPYLGFEDIKS